MVKDWRYFNQAVVPQQYARLVKVNVDQ